MIQLGEVQTLTIVKKVAFGVYLAGEEGEEKVLLPAKQVPEDAVAGSCVEVFVYRDSKDRLIATVNRPYLTLGQVGWLDVVEISPIGAFLNWGLEKDLFLPFREQTRKVKAGEKCLAAVYIDKSSRLCATMNVYYYLYQNSPYHKEDWVNGTVYETSREFGAFVAVDDRYSGLIPRKELYGDIAIGGTVRARVTEVREDGKLDLSLREKAHIQINTDSDRILQALRERGGVLPFTDKASPEVINREMGMSKNEFKRAVGHLLKENRIRIEEQGISLIR